MSYTPYLNLDNYVKRCRRAIHAGDLETALAEIHHIRDLAQGLNDGPWVEPWIGDALRTQDPEALLSALDRVEDVLIRRVKR